MHLITYWMYDAYLCFKIFVYMGLTFTKWISVESSPSNRIRNVNLPCITFCVQILLQNQQWFYNINYISALFPFWAIWHAFLMRNSTNSSDTCGNVPRRLYFTFLESRLFDPDHCPVLWKYFFLCNRYFPIIY